MLFKNYYSYLLTDMYDVDVIYYTRMNTITSNHIFSYLALLSDLNNYLE